MAARGTEREMQRMEALSDGVFAIAITLLAVDIRSPTPEGVDGTLAGALRGMWHSYLAYAISFVFIGIYWVNHSYASRLYAATDHGFTLLHLLFLMAVSLLPFPTGVLAEFAADEANRATAERVYVASLFFVALSWFMKWMYASRPTRGRPAGRLMDPRLDPRYVRRMTAVFGVSVALYLGAVVLAVVAPGWGLALAVALTLWYLLPSRTPEYVGGA